MIAPRGNRTTLKEMKKEPPTTVTTAGTDYRSKDGNQHSTHPHVADFEVKNERDYSEENQK